MSLDQLSLKDIKKIDSFIEKDVLKILKTENSIYSKKSYGGTSLQNVVKMLKKLKKEFK
jgi:argininosuccinate lyase